MPECKSRPGKSEPLLPVSVGVGLRPAKLREKKWGTLSSRVAHALLRAASALLPTPAAQGAEASSETRRGTQECVHHEGGFSTLFSVSLAGYAPFSQCARKR